MNLRTTLRVLIRFSETWNRDRWELVVLAIPLTRGLLFLIDLAPGQVTDEVVPDPWVPILLGLLAVGSLIAITGVMKSWPILERAGLQVSGPIAGIYGIASFASSWRLGLVALIVYGMVAACCAARSVEITRALRIENTMLLQAARDRSTNRETDPDAP